MEYSIRYTETYQRWYNVEADTEEQAVEKLESQIMNGEVNAPDECVNSDYEVYKEDN